MKPHKVIDVVNAPQGRSFDSSLFFLRQETNRPYQCATGSVVGTLIVNSRSVSLGTRIG
jgi:hypothetical protein